MTQDPTHVEASLLYRSPCAPFTAIDTVALRSAFAKLGATVRDIEMWEAESLLVLLCDRFWVSVAKSDRPMALEAMRRAARTHTAAKAEPGVLTIMARHRSYLTVNVGLYTDAAEEEGRALQRELCLETVDLLLETTTPELVYLADTGQLLTAPEAQVVLDGGWGDDELDAVAKAQPKGTKPKIVQAIPEAIRPARPVRPEAATPRPDLLPPRNTHSIQLPPTYAEAVCLDAMRAQRADQPQRSTPRPAHLLSEPLMSDKMVKWLDEEDGASGDMAALRAFFALDDSPEPRRLAETATGRASLYIMSATIAVFALPVGASMLTYNALSGGSFRATSHMMALTGIGLALTSMGMPNPAEALAMRF